MKTVFKVYDEKKVEDETREVVFRMVSLNGVPTLVVCDSEGKRLFGGSVAYITERGTLALCGSVSEGYGLCLDKNNRIVTVKDYD